MKSKIIFPLICMIVGVAGSVCEFVGALNDKDLDEKIAEEVSRQLNNEDETEA